MGRPTPSIAWAGANRSRIERRIGIAKYLHFSISVNRARRTPPRRSPPLGRCPAPRRQPAPSSLKPSTPLSHCLHSTLDRTRPRMRGWQKVLDGPHGLVRLHSDIGSKEGLDMDVSHGVVTTVDRLGGNTWLENRTHKGIPLASDHFRSGLH
jgi:hypothetical protein